MSDKGKEPKANKGLTEKAGYEGNRNKLSSKGLSSSSADRLEKFIAFLDSHLKESDPRYNQTLMKISKFMNNKPSNQELNELMTEIERDIVKQLRGPYYKDD